jgi:hypothetical protein
MKTAEGKHDNEYAEGDYGTTTNIKKQQPTKNTRAGATEEEKDHLPKM